MIDTDCYWDANLTPRDYDRIESAVVDLYTELGIRSFPIDPFLLLRSADICSSHIPKYQKKRGNYYDQLNDRARVVDLLTAYTRYFMMMQTVNVVKDLQSCTKSVISN